MKLFEVLGTPYEFALTYDRRRAGNWEAIFRAGPDRVEVIFQHWEKPDLHELYFDRGDSISLTGKGDALRIFSTVLAVTRQFIEKVEPRALTFTAKKDEPSRVTLYKRLVKKLVPGSGYKDVTNDLAEVSDETIKDWFERRVLKYPDESQFLLLREDLLEP